MPNEVGVMMTGVDWIGGSEEPVPNEVGSAMDNADEEELWLPKDIGTATDVVSEEMSTLGLVVRI